MDLSKTAETEKYKIKIARNSLLVAVFIVTMKLIATILSGSLAVLSELFHSSTDLIAALATLISLNYSSKPPDDKHHYGHDKIESFSALFQVLILILMCVYILYEAVDRIIHPTQNIDIDVFTFSVIIIAILLDLWRSRVLKKAAIKTKSQALEADSLHFSSDILSSVLVLAGMFLYRINPVFDPIAAIAVSIIIIITTFNLSKKAFDTLLDKTPKGLSEEIRNEILNIPGIESVKSLRIRSTGAKIFIDMVINIARTKLFSESHGILNAVERKIREIAPGADIVIHPEPVETKDETINDKVRMIVNEAGYKCHDIFSHKIGNEIFTELHIEIAHTNNLVTAHSDIDKLEKEILDKIPVINHIKIHLDEPSGLIYETEDITEKSPELINKINEVIESVEDILHFHDIRIISSEGKIRVSLNCEFHKGKTLEEVHELVTIYESRLFLKLKKINPKITNVIIHAEPIGHE